jgi:hypothetical protein
MWVLSAGSHLRQSRELEDGQGELVPRKVGAGDGQVLQDTGGNVAMQRGFPCLLLYEDYVSLCVGFTSKCDEAKQSKATATAPYHIAEPMITIPIRQASCLTFSLVSLVRRVRDLKGTPPTASFLRRSDNAELRSK